MMEENYDNSFRVRYIKGEKWAYDTIFTVHNEDRTIDLSDGDLDSSSGDLEEWDSVDFDTIPQVNELLSKMIKPKTEIELNKEEKDFFARIDNPDVKKLFLLLLVYCNEENKGSMANFRKLLDENNIKNNYSAYRSSSSY